MKRESAAFGAGCFWGVQSKFDAVPGVLKTEVGYMGGDEEYEKVSYKQVCTGNTGHAEVIKIEFDPLKVMYLDLLRKFWEIHNPTTLNRQGYDMGTQYRSVIFYFNAEQKKQAEASLEKAQEKLDKKIVTDIVKAGKFYKAEEYHQKYEERKG
jgi:peptide-methionine (S)-S-oxide reductase